MPPPERRSPSIPFPTPPAALGPSQFPSEPPNRPLGQDLTLDAVDALLSGLGLTNGMDSKGSSAGVLGSAAAMLPLDKMLQMIMGSAGKVKQATNMGDALLRSHTLENPSAGLDSRITGLAPTRSELPPEELIKQLKLRSPEPNPKLPGGARPAEAPDYVPVPTHTDFGTNAGSEPLTPWLLANKDDINFHDSQLLAPKLKVRPGTSKFDPAEARLRGELMNGLVKSSDWPDSVKIAVNEEAKRHPRTLGHVGELSIHEFDDPAMTGRLGDQWSMQNTRAERGNLPGDSLEEFTSRVRVKDSIGVNATIPHELTHVGQQLKGGHKFEGEYAKELAKGDRKLNKFEQEADKVGANALLSSKTKDEQRWISRLRKVHGLDSPDVNKWPADHRMLVRDMFEKDLEALKRGDHSRGQFKK